MKNFQATLGSMLPFLFFLLLFSVSSARAQETGGGLTGTIVDTTGQPVAGATVTALHTSSGTRYATATGADGRYSLPGLRIGGPYTLTVSYAGATPKTESVIRVPLGEPVTLNVVLAIAPTSLETVVVKGVRPGARANGYGAGLNITGDQVRNLPTISRSLQELTRLVPQASRDNSFAGTNFRYNNVTIDGAINNDAIGFSPSLGGVTGTSGLPGSSTRTNAISLDAIEDMQVYIAPYDVKIGNFTGASINAVTRSGTNTITGSIYAVGRNAAITGPDRQGTEGALSSDFYDYQTGFRLGFPLLRNKLFWFTNEEITRRVDPIGQNAGSQESAPILSLADAQKISDTTLQRYGFNAGTYGQYNVYSRSNKFFNRLDWNIDAHSQLIVRNNTIRSQAVNLERDAFDFRFGSIAYEQVNNQTSTVAELKTRFNNYWSNSLLAGLTLVHDYRKPFGDPSLPQVQIAGRTPGTTIFLGTDREASIFDQKQRTIEVTDNLTWRTGAHTVLFGTHNEFYHINYGFVNSWNGRVDYLSIEDYLNNNPYRVRGSYNYGDNTRAYILSHPTAVFDIDFLSVYAQDEIRVSEKLKVTPGLRFDYTYLPAKPVLADRTRNALEDGYYGTTYTYNTPLDQIRNQYLNRVQVSPRIGIRYDWFGNQKLILRGGMGLFTGRIPLAWLGYAYYNNGNDYGSYDQKADGKSFTAGSNPVNSGHGSSGLLNPDGIADFIQLQGTNVHNKASGTTQVDVFDNGFIMPQIFRGSAGLDYTMAKGWKFTFEAIYTKSLKDVEFQQINQSDNPQYYAYDAVTRLQPIFRSGAAGKVDPHFSNAYLISNTKEGFRYSLTGTIHKTWSAGPDISASYTYGQSKDIANGIRNSAESNWQLNQALNPNNPGLAWSNFDIRHRIVISGFYRKNWSGHLASLVSLFFSAQSGSPFTYGFVNSSVQGTSQQVSLAYIPYRQEAINFLQDYTDQMGLSHTAAEQAAQFNAFIDGNKYLSSRRGGFTGRNEGRTPWNTRADVRLTQEFQLGRKDSRRMIEVTLDIINLTNLLDKNWGIYYFSPNTFNSTSSVGLTPVLAQSENGLSYPVYTFQDPGKPYSIDYFNSRAQFQLGLRYSF